VAASFPASAAARLDQALLELASKTQHLGQSIRIGSEGAMPLILAQNSTEVFFVIREFEEQGFLRGRTTSLPTDVNLTAKALNRAVELQRGLFGPLSKQAFVAMSFHTTLDEAWTQGLNKGIEDCGFTALRIDTKEHNEDTNDVKVAEIRKSKFMVADFNDHKHGVYFEAGMMMGLGRSVIFTCREDELTKAHFDTRQYSHIV